MDVTVGEYVILRCGIVRGSGNIRLRWLLDGVPVENGPVSSSVTVGLRICPIDDPQGNIENQPAAPTGAGEWGIRLRTTGNERVGLLVRA